MSFHIAALLFLGLGFLLSQANFGGPEIFKNGPYVVTYIVSLLSLLSIFVSMLFCAGVVLRDSAYKMDALVFTTAIRKKQYFTTRLGGLLFAVFLVLALAVLGIYIGGLLSAQEKLGPFHFINYLQPLLVFGLPNILFCCSIIFATTMLTGSAKAVYASGVLLFMFYLTASILGNSPFMASSALKLQDKSILPVLIDPFGITAFFGETRSWAAEQRNHDLFSLQGLFLVNRLAWTGFSLLILFISYIFFKFRLRAAGSIDKKIEKTAVRLIPYQTVAIKPKGIFYQLRVLLSQLKFETLAVFKHVPFIVMLVLWIFLNAIDMKESVLNGPYGIRFYAATGYLAEELLAMKPALLLLIFYAAELIGRERSSNMQGLVFSTPVSTMVLWTAKSATLALLIAMLVSANILIGLGVQLITGYTEIEWSIYFSLYYYAGLPLLLFSLLIIFIQTLISNRYAGMLISLTVIGCILFSDMFGIKSFLLRYATMPGLQFSEMNGFGHYTAAVHWYILYWTLLALILSLLAAGAWQGSNYISFRQRLQSIPKRLGWPGKLLLVLCTITWIGVGAYISRQTGSTESYRRGGLSGEWKLQYEQKYKPAAGLLQPIITSVNTTVAIYPDKGLCTVKGTYRFRNETSTSIRELWLGTDPSVKLISLYAKGAVQLSADTAFHQYRYRLENPMLPGEEGSLEFSLEINRSGFKPFNSENSVVSNGSYIELEKYIPYFGYNDRYEISNAEERRQKKLPASIYQASTDSNYHLVNFETTVSTSKDQQVVTVGGLQKEWAVGNRRYFHYKASQPIAFMFALSSARYSIRQENYKGIQYRIYYQPGQTKNLSLMMQAMKDAVEYGTENFRPYQFDYLTLAAIPQYPGSATAYPGVIFSSEKLNFMANFSDSSAFNHTYATTAHEVAHQWWANQLMPLGAPGKAMLSESLAKYTEAMVVEKRFGKTRLRKYLQTDNQLYFAMRTGVVAELPLASTIDQPFVYYQKGGLVLYGLKEVLGEKHVNKALQNMISGHSAGKPKASSRDLRTEISRGADSSQLSLISDAMDKVIIHNNSLKLLEIRQLPDGKYRLRVQVNIHKTDQRGGKRNRLASDGYIQIAVLDQPADDWALNTVPICLHTYQLSDENTVLTIELDKKPGSVFLDPYNWLLDEDTSDNVVDIQ